MHACNTNHRCLDKLAPQFTTGCGSQSLCFRKMQVFMTIDAAKPESVKADVSESRQRPEQEQQTLNLQSWAIC